MTQPSQSLPFTPASSMNYECTIHTLRLHGDDGASYRVVLDLIRSNKNPSWGVDEDRLALRAAVLDSSGQAIGSVFVDTPKSNFEPSVGRMLSLGEQRNISFVAARAPDGSMIDGTLDFDLHVDILQSGFVQTFADKVKASLERALDNVGPSAQSKAPLPLQLLVTDYPHTRHTGTVAVKLPGKDEPLVLKADATRSTMSHHYGNALTTKAPKWKSPWAIFFAPTKMDMPHSICCMSTRSKEIRRVSLKWAAISGESP